MNTNKRRPPLPSEGTAWLGTAAGPVGAGGNEHQDQARLEQFEARLSRCLTDLGKLDYSLQSAIDGLLTGLDADIGRTLREARELARLSTQKPSYLT